MYPINEDTLSFTTTAMPRPDIIEKTYASASRMLLDIDLKKCTLYINIDNFPNHECSEKKEEVIKIARKYFGNVIPNMPESPNFANAVKWCFSRIETYYNFHLEDDWEILTPMKINNFNQFFIPPHVQQVALRAWKFAGSNFWLSPSFMRGTFCRTVADKMNNEQNPEIQIRGMKGQFKNDAFITFPFDHRAVVLRDLGRNWMKVQNFNRGDANFTAWQVREEGKGIQKLADQNAQIPKYMCPRTLSKHVAMNNKAMNRAQAQRQRTIKLRRKGNK